MTPLTVVTDIFHYAAHPEELPFLLTYSAPKLAFESTISIASWGAKKIYNIGKNVAEQLWLVPPVGSNVTGRNVTNETNITDVFVTNITQGFNSTVSLSPFEKKLAILHNKLAEKAANLSLEATSWTTGKNITEIKETLLLDESSFQASDLIPSALLLSFCVNKAKTNFASASYNFWLLLKQTKMLSRAFQSRSLNGDTIAIGGKTEFYTTGGQFKNSLMETIYGALWTTGAYFTYQSIYKAVLDASNSNATQASFIANMILVNGVFGPIIYGAIEQGLFMPPRGEHKSSKLAPQFDHSDPKEKKRIVDTDDENVTDEEKLAYLVERSKPIVITAPAA